MQSYGNWKKNHIDENRVYVAIYSQENVFNNFQSLKIIGSLDQNYTCVSDDGNQNDFFPSFVCDYIFDMTHYYTWHVTQHNILTVFEAINCLRLSFRYERTILGEI